MSAEVPAGGEGGEVDGGEWLRFCSAADLARGGGRYHARVAADGAVVGGGGGVVGGGGVGGGGAAGACDHAGGGDAGEGGRHVSVLSVDGEVYAIDSICYHAGGPLAVGDIEDVNGHPCVLCPWHHYKVSVRTGEKWYQAAKFVDGKLVPSGWESVGVRQRTHAARVDADTGDVWVRLRLEGEVQSDKYAHDDSCAIRAENAVGADGRVSGGGGRNGGGGSGGGGVRPRRSGHVVAAARESGMLRMPGRPPAPR